MKVWTYHRGGEWTQEELPWKEGGGTVEQMMERNGFTEAGVSLEPETGPEVYFRPTEGDGELQFLVSFEGIGFWEVILAPTWPDLLALLIWLAPLIQAGAVSEVADLLSRWRG